jgi:hypothetical protein
MMNWNRYVKKLVEQGVETIRKSKFYWIAIIVSVLVAATGFYTSETDARFLLNGIFQGISAALALLISGFVFLKQRLIDVEGKLEDIFDEERTTFGEYLDFINKRSINVDGGNIGELSAQVQRAKNKKEKTEVMQYIAYNFDSEKIYAAVQKFAERKLGTPVKVSHMPYENNLYLVADNEKYRINISASGVRIWKETETQGLVESPPVSRHIKPVLDEILEFAQLSFKFDKSIYRLPMHEYSSLVSATSREFSASSFLIICFTVSIVLCLPLMALTHLYGGIALMVGIAVASGLTTFGVCLLSYLLFLILRS